MFHITNHQGSVHQNNKVSPYTGQKGYYQKDKKCVGEDVEKRAPPPTIYHWWDFKLVQPLWKTVQRSLKWLKEKLPSVQFNSVTQSCLTLWNPMNHSTPGLPVHHQLPEFIPTHVHQVSDAIQPSHPLSSPSPPAPNPSQHQSLFQWVNSWHEVAKVLEFQL